VVDASGGVRRAPGAIALFVSPPRQVSSVYQESSFIKGATTFAPLSTSKKTLSVGGGCIWRSAPGSSRSLCLATSTSVLRVLGIFIYQGCDDLRSSFHKQEDSLCWWWMHHLEECARLQEPSLSLSCCLNKCPLCTRNLYLSSVRDDPSLLFPPSALVLLESAPNVCFDDRAEIFKGQS
jgi:hypothetical protein